MIGRDGGVTPVVRTSLAKLKNNVVLLLCRFVFSFCFFCCFPAVLYVMITYEIFLVFFRRPCINRGINRLY